MRKSSASAFIRFSPQRSPEVTRDPTSMKYSARQMGISVSAISFGAGPISALMVGDEEAVSGRR